MKWGMWSPYFAGLDQTLYTGVTSTSHNVYPVHKRCSSGWLLHISYCLPNVYVCHIPFFLEPSVMSWSNLAFHSIFSLRKFPGVNVNVGGYLCLCVSPMIDWWPVQGVSWKKMDIWADEWTFPSPGPAWLFYLDWIRGMPFRMLSWGFPQKICKF